MEIKQTALKSVQNVKDPGGQRPLSEIRVKLEESLLPDFKLYYKAIVTKTV